MDLRQIRIGNRGTLYPDIKPFFQQEMAVGDGHVIHVEQCGNPDGIPVVVLHGGPGGGCSPKMRKLFNPRKYRIVLFDQRGCGLSRPSGSARANTTWHLLSDIEFIRKELDIDHWVVFGGSWGAALGILYAQENPERVLHLVLRGIFLMTQAELDWFYRGGTRPFWPDAWEILRDKIPPEEHEDLIAAYHRRVFCGDYKVECEFGKAWLIWENQLSTIGRSDLVNNAPERYARVFARIETHYFVNAGFLEDPDHILNNMDRIAHLGGTIVQGRLDLVCPPLNAFRLHKRWPGSELRMVSAGHALSEPEIARELVTVMDELIIK